MSNELKRSLTPVMVWGLGVGYVISGNYFGWNLGLEKGGTLGLAAALVFVIIMYVTFTFSYTELACAIPKAGGAFDYVRRALGDDLGFLAGMAQNIEFIFAPPAIAFAIGAYFNLYFSQIPVLFFSIAAYFVFVSINMAGVKIAAAFELAVTSLAVLAIVFFATLTLPHFQFSNLGQNALPHGWTGVLAAVPFAIWFFLGIEGVANLAEEAINPKRTILLGFGSAIVTLVMLCVVTFTSSVGLAGWEAIVFKSDGAMSDSPLPLVWEHLAGTGTWQYELFVGIGLFGLVASFHGLILAAGRSTYEFGKAGFAPASAGRVHPRFQTPVNALLYNMTLGIIALLTGRTGEIITISVMGALTLYIVSMVALLRLRATEPQLLRPFRVPLYPFFPWTALVIATMSLLAVAFYNTALAVLYVIAIAVAYGVFRLRKGRNN